MFAWVRQETFYAIPTNYAIGKFVSQAFQEWLYWFIFSAVCLNKISSNTSFLKLFLFKILLTSAAFIAWITRRLLLRWLLLHKQLVFWQSWAMQCKIPNLCLGDWNFSFREKFFWLSPTLSYFIFISFFLCFLEPLFRGAFSLPMNFLHATLVSALSPVPILPKTPLPWQLAPLQVEDKE